MTFIHELEAIVYPKRGRWRSEITEKPSWKQIENAIRQLDRHGHPYLKMFLAPPKLETDLQHLSIMGGLGEYGLLTFDARHHQLQWYSDLQRPDGPELVEIWTSDQGAAFAERYLCNDLAVVLRIAKCFAKTGQLDSNVNWENWPPPRLRRP